jgi:hypothetical protein
MNPTEIALLGAKQCGENRALTTRALALTNESVKNAAGRNFGTRDTLNLFRDDSLVEVEPHLVQLSADVGQPRRLDRLD